MKFQSLLLATAVACSIVACKPKGEPVELKINMPVGKTYTTTTKIDAKMKMMGMDMGTSMEMVFDMTATGKEGDLTNIESSFQSMKMDIPMTGVSYDSKKDNADSPMGMMDSIMGKKFTMIMDKQGAVKEVKGMDELFSGIGGGANMKNNFGQGMAALPSKPVAPGESWDSETEMNNNGMNMKLKNKWTLESVSNGIAHIKVKSTFENGNSEIEGQKVELTGSQSGTVDVEVATGVSVKSDIVQDMEMSVAGQKMTMKNTISLETK